MTKLTPFLLIPILFLSSCSIDWNDGKDAKIAELEKQIQDDTFNKKKECSDYESKFMDKMKVSGWSYYLDENFSSFNKDEIFYSKKYGTCMISFFVYPIKKTGVEIADATTYQIIDMFSDKSMELLRYVPGKTDLDTVENSFKKSVNELKGE